MVLDSIFGSKLKLMGSVTFAIFFIIKRLPLHFYWFWLTTFDFIDLFKCIHDKCINCCNTVKDTKLLTTCWVRFTIY